MRRTVFLPMLFHAVLVVECATNFPQGDDEELKQSRAPVSGLVAPGQQRPLIRGSHVKECTSPITSLSPAEDHTSASDVQSQDGAQADTLRATTWWMRSSGQTPGDYLSEDADDGPASLKSDSGSVELAARRLIGLVTTAVEGGSSWTSSSDIECARSPSMLRAAAPGGSFLGPLDYGWHWAERGFASPVEKLVMPFSGLVEREQQRPYLKRSQVNESAFGYTSSAAKKRSSVSDERQPQSELVGAAPEWVRPAESTDSDNPSDGAFDEPRSLKSLPELVKQAARGLINLERTAAQDDSPLASTSHIGGFQYPCTLRAAASEVDFPGSVDSDFVPDSPRTALASLVEKVEKAILESSEAWLAYTGNKESAYLECMNFLAAEKLLDTMEELDMALCLFPRSEREKYLELRGFALDALERAQQD